jgi:hypothetical protein
MASALLVLGPAGRVSRATRTIYLSADDLGGSAQAAAAQLSAGSGRASCAPATVNRSALLGGAVTVSPTPGLKGREGRKLAPSPCE